MLSVVTKPRSTVNGDLISWENDFIKQAVGGKRREQKGKKPSRKSTGARLKYRSNDMEKEPGTECQCRGEGERFPFKAWNARESLQISLFLLVEKWS